MANDKTFDSFFHFWADEAYFPGGYCVDAPDTKTTKSAPSHTYSTPGNFALREVAI